MGAKKELLEFLHSIKGFLLPDNPVIMKVIEDKSAGIRFSGARLLKKNGHEQLK